MTRLLSLLLCQAEEQELERAHVAHQGFYGLQPAAGFRAWVRAKFTMHGR